MSNSLTTPRKKRESKSMRLKVQRSARWRGIRQCISEIEQERVLFEQRITISIIDPTDRKESYSAIIDSRRGIVIK